MEKREIYTSLILFFIFLVSYFLEGFLWVLWTMLSLTLYCIISYIFYYLWKLLRTQRYLTGFEYVQEFFYRVANITLLLTVVLWSFVAYENEINPATMPLYTLSNGSKTVFFQWMVHIGRADFYKQVQENLKEKKKAGAVLFYEGVKPGTKENMEKFDAAIGIKFSKELYKNFSKLYGVTFQDNQDLLWIVNNKDVNVDISIDDIMKFYDTESAKDKTAPASITDINQMILDDLANLDEKKLKILVYLNQAIMSTLIKSDFFKKTLMDEFGNKALFDVILQKRNENLAKAIETSSEKQIFVTYWLLHFDGVLELLQKNDSKWQVTETQYLYPFHVPRKWH